jgi:hypothetical protein
MPMLDRHRLRLMAQPASWSALANDALWNLQRTRPDPLRPTWPLSEEMLAAARIRWPAVYENPRAVAFFEFAVRRFRQFVPVELADIPQQEPGLVTFELLLAGERHLIAIDYFDFVHLNATAVESCSLYFKMQHLEEGYDRENVVPGGYVAKRQLLYRFLPQLRSRRDRCRFAYDVYGRFSLTFQPELRGRIAEVLTNQDFEFEGGTRLLMYSRHLRDIARSRVCIDVPGQGPLCHRLVDYLSIGACVVGVRPKVVLPLPLEHGVHVHWVRDDLSDLADACRTYVESNTMREELARNARDYFDRVLHQEQLADYYLYTCLHRLR